jgi:hypothetical protein
LFLLGSSIFEHFYLKALQRRKIATSSFPLPTLCLPLPFPLFCTRSLQQQNYKTIKTICTPLPLRLNELPKSRMMGISKLKLKLKIKKKQVSVFIIF